jgi:hypothetical protein
MAAALKRQHPARKEGPHNILGAEVGLLLALLNILSHPLGLSIIPGVVEPVCHRGGLGMYSGRLMKSSGPPFWT